MNDKNFLEELKQKRDEYGVTQIQIATACEYHYENIITVLKTERLFPLIHSRKRL